MISIQPASPELRREHSRALRKRDQWRDRYREVSLAIRGLKDRINRANRAGTFDRQAEVMLSGMCRYADELMFERYAIKMALRSTSYQYVDAAEPLAA
jgi:hypothetical protein